MRANRAADVTPAIVRARRTTLVLGAVDRGRHWGERNAERLEGRAPDFTVPESLQRRHRIRVGDGTPAAFLFGVAGHAEVARDAIVEGRQVVIGNRPVQSLPVETFDA